MVESLTSLKGILSYWRNCHVFEADVRASIKIAPFKTQGDRESRLPVELWL